MLGNDLLVGSADIADRLGFASLQNVHYHMRTDPTFPEPLDTIRGAKVWSWPDVEAWVKTRDLRIARPAKPPRSQDFQAALERVAIQMGLGREQAADLVGAYEIAVRLGLDDTMIVYDWAWTQGTTFPKWAQRIGPGGGTYVWWWSDVEQWAESRYPDQIERWRILTGEQDEATPATSNDDQNGEQRTTATPPSATKEQEAKTRRPARKTGAEVPVATRRLDEKTADPRGGTKAGSK